MGAHSTSEVVLVLFPFSDLSQAKIRPALVLANIDRGDSILCQITSNPYGDTKAIELTEENFVVGSLDRVSYARPGKLFTANQSLVVSQIGTLNAARFGIIVEAVIDILYSSVRR